jgi:hypothetical protein
MPIAAAAIDPRLANPFVGALLWAAMRCEPDLGDGRQLDGACTVLFYPSAVGYAP